MIILDSSTEMELRKAVSAIAELTLRVRELETKVATGNIGKKR